VWRKHINPEFTKWQKDRTNVNWARGIEQCLLMSVLLTEVAKRLHPFVGQVRGVDRCTSARVLTSAPVQEAEQVMSTTRWNNFII